MTANQLETMIRLSKECVGWEIPQREFRDFDHVWGVEIMQLDLYPVAVATSANNAYYIANAPKTILALAEKLAQTEARLAEAEARLSTRGEYSE